jgi:hypothetical protein
MQSFAFCETFRLTAAGFNLRTAATSYLVGNLPITSSITILGFSSSYHSIGSEWICIKV